jgi:arsenate reductase
MLKNVLILCTGNSCRSIIAEALVNKELDKYDIKAYSSGVKASGKINPNAKKVLQDNNCWKEEYHSKAIEDIINIDYDLIVTVCDNAKESCPVFPKKSKVIHIGFDDPDGKDYSEFIKTYQLIKDNLIFAISKELIK